MNFKELILVTILIIVSVGLLTYPVSAESGNITITQTTQKTYNSASSGIAGVVNFNKIYWDTANYNTINDFKFTTNTGETMNFVHDFESTTFTISSGGSGSGVAWYDRNSSYAYWVFTSGATFTSSPLTLSYSKNIFINVSASTNNYDSTFSVGLANPVGIEDSGYQSAVRRTYIANMASITTDQYTVTYPSPTLFTVNVIKGNLQTKHIIHSSTITYTTESSFNTVPYQFTGTFADGLYINVTMASGAYTNVLVNSTRSGMPTPAPTPVINPLTGVGIIFDSPTYALGDIANISWIRTTGTPLLCTDYVRLQTPSSKYDLVVSPSDSGFTKELLSEVGTYDVSFERACLFSGTEILDHDTASIGLNEQTSYIHAPAQIGIGQLFNVTYLIGWTKTTGSTVWLRDYTWNDATNSYGATYQPWALSGSKGVETNESILVTKAGKHLLKICDVLLGCKASTILTAFFNGSEVTTNISVSNITIDKTSYSYGETILVKTAVDNFNWSNKQIVVEYENYGQNSIQNQQYIQNQTESFPLYIQDLTFSGSGLSRLRLTAKNSTGSYILAYVNFTLSSVDSEGYGLSLLGDTNCINDIAAINVIVPAGESGNLTISADDAKYNKVYSINGTKTISYKYQIAGTYYITLSVNGEAKRNIIKVLSSTGSCAVITPTPTPYKGINGTWAPTNENIKDTCSYWDLWVRGIFGTQGVNDVTRILFALGAIVAMMFIGLIASKGNFGVAIILGFFPYAFFTYMTLSTPCGQYMPLWINIFIALIIGIKMKWFS